MSPNDLEKQEIDWSYFPIYTLLLFPDLAGADRWPRHPNHIERGQGHIRAPHTTTLRCVPPTSPPQQITRQIMNRVPIPAPKQSISSYGFKKQCKFNTYTDSIIILKKLLHMLSSSTAVLLLRKMVWKYNNWYWRRITSEIRNEILLAIITLFDHDALVQLMFW